jgi:hypothetical protein
MRAVNPAITPALVADMCQRQQTSLESPGACTHCGATFGDVEPDIEDDVCEHCGQQAVCGCETLLIRLF